MTIQQLKARLTARVNAEIDAMSAEALLEFIDRPLLPSEARKVDGPSMVAKRRAVARLETLTAP